MLIVFEVYTMATATPQDVISEEVQKETMAQIMSPAEAEAVGFGSLPEPPENRKLLLVACADKDAKYVQNRLERSEAVTGFRAHEVEV